MNTDQQYFVDEELEHYRDGWINRREFMRRATLFGATTAVAIAMSDGIVPRPTTAAPAAQGSPSHVPADDQRVSATWTSFISTDGISLKAYVARPSLRISNLPGVAICHAIGGLTAHVQDVARRFAVNGYVAIAPDLPSRTGTATDEFVDDADRMRAFSLLTPEQNALDFAAALDFLAARGDVDGSRLAATGYCFGGGVIWRLATVAPNLRVAAPFYGSAPPLEAVPNIRAAMLGVYAGTDDRINAGIPGLESAMDAAGVTYRSTIYPGADHGFHDDSGRVYHPEMAARAWEDTLSWFDEHLNSAM